MVGQRLALAHAGDLDDQIVEALEVLDVDGRPDVDAGVEQLLDVLPALRVARRRLAAGEVGVRELIDQQDGGMPRERRVEIELLAHDAAVAHRERRQARQALEQPLGLDATVRLDVAHDHVGAGGAHAARGLEHRVGLADAGGGAEENAQTARAGRALPRPGLRSSSWSGSGRGFGHRLGHFSGIRAPG